jgi:hypothetical protein
MAYRGAQTQQALTNRHQERSGGTATAKALTSKERNVAGTFLWFVSFGVKRNEHPLAWIKQTHSSRTLSIIYREIASFLAMTG